ncbi:MAG: formylmethanofuran dehydrogenase [Nitrospirae bacterium]|nr:formylmethanofuran dehydrogenase [Nitrospirota bacterium]
MGFTLTKSKAKTDSSLDNMLKKTAGFHGHLCPGTVIGTRMAIAGLREVGITDPEGSQQKDFLVFIETDRCPIDAISVVSGARISRRSLKFLDWGKVAATFVNTKTGKAVRIICPDSAREHVDDYVSGEYPDDKHGKTAREVDAYKVMPEKELFVITKVKVDNYKFSKEKFKTRCEVCGEVVNDHKEIVVDGKVMCQSCGGGMSYYNAL